MKIMVMIFFLVFFGLLDLPKMWRKRDNYEMWIFGVMLAIGITYGIVFALNVPLPDPNGLIRMIFEPLGKEWIKPIS